MTLDIDLMFQELEVVAEMYVRRNGCHQRSILAKRMLELEALVKQTCHLLAMFPLAAPSNVAPLYRGASWFCNHEQ